MNIDDIIGYYTYRSFLNETGGTPDEILWGEGELLIFVTDDGRISGTLSFPSDPGAEQKEFMDLSGSVENWSNLELRFIGKGRKGSAIAEFEYEYDCQAAHEWDTANPPQRLSLVGTVRRNKDHGQAKAGVTASFIAVKRSFIEPRDIPGVALIPEAVSMLAERKHRLRHTVWHTIRGDWYSENMTDTDRDRLGKLGWYLSDPPFNSEGSLDLSNGAGEDFLYMHRRMIMMLHNTYKAVGKEPPESWKSLPNPTAAQFEYLEDTHPDDSNRLIYKLDTVSSGYMVPPATEEFLEQVGGHPFFRFNKTSRGLTNLMRNMVSNLRNPRVVSQLTLGTYGNLVEFTVHNWMHMRWATISRNPQSGVPEVRDSYDVNKKWDDPKHDYLGDFHSSHVNPIFWKLHGWVDDCIDFWFEAHEKAHPGEVAAKEVRGVNWFTSKCWVVKDEPLDWPGAGQGHEHNSSEIETLESVMNILKEVAERKPAGILAETVQLRELKRRLPGFAQHLDDEL